MSKRIAPAFSDPAIGEAIVDLAQRGRKAVGAGFDKLTDKLLVRFAPLDEAPISEVRRRGRNVTDRRRSARIAKEAAIKEDKAAKRASKTFAKRSGKARMDSYWRGVVEDRVTSSDQVLGDHKAGKIARDPTGGTHKRHRAGSAAEAKTIAKGETYVRTGSGPISQPRPALTWDAVKTREGRAAFKEGNILYRERHLRNLGLIESDRTLPTLTEELTHLVRRVSDPFAELLRIGDNLTKPQHWARTFKAAAKTYGASATRGSIYDDILRQGGRRADDIFLERAVRSGDFTGSAQKGGQVIEDMSRSGFRPTTRDTHIVPSAKPGASGGRLITPPTPASATPPMSRTAFARGGYATAFTQTPSRLKTKTSQIGKAANVQGGRVFRFLGRGLPILSGALDLTAVANTLDDGGWKTGKGWGKAALFGGDAALATVGGLWAELPAIGIEATTGQKNRGVISALAGETLGLDESWTFEESALDQIIDHHTQGSNPEDIWETDEEFEEDYQEYLRQHAIAEESKLKEDRIQRKLSRARELAATQGGY